MVSIRIRYSKYQNKVAPLVWKGGSRHNGLAAPPHKNIQLLESERLMKVLSRLKEHERRLLFARVFVELTFEEMGKKFNMKPKQAEMAFYYILRKVRKEMEVSGKDEF